MSAAASELRPRAVTEPHTRLLRCALEVDESHAYWQRSDGSTRARAEQAFSEYWFGARSMARVEVLLANMHARFDAFPAALRTLHRWPDMSFDVRRVVCHWHLQLSDPLYRAFSGEFLVERRASIRPHVTRDLVYAWVRERLGRGSVSTHLQWASKLLSAAYSAGLVTSNRDPRPLDTPRVEPLVLEYLLYLLRGVEFEQPLLDNPYLASVGLVDSALDERLRRFPAASIRLVRQGKLVEMSWQWPDLEAWGRARFPDAPVLATGSGP